MIFLVALLAATQPSQAQSFAGPALMCGESFAMRLLPGETATRRSPVEDFVIYRLAGPEGIVVLYEGNAPQPHDDEIRTGFSWPSVIAIHDNRGAQAKARSRVRDRLLIGRARPAQCPPGEVQP